MATLTIELSDALVQRLQEYCAEVGISISKRVSEFVEEFLPRAIDDDGGYEIAPDSELWEAFAEIEEMKRHPEKYKAYTDLDEMERDIIAEFAEVSDEDLSV